MAMTRKMLKKMVRVMKKVMMSVVVCKHHHRESYWVWRTNEPIADVAYRWIEVGIRHH